jgi:nitrate reductase delta subunit
VHDALARLVEYPREGWLEQAAQGADVVACADPAAGAALRPFLDWARACQAGELEEQYARTFDNTDERALEVGWHAFGENYGRGNFMAALRRGLRAHGIEEHGELPDHLSHVLPLLGRCEERHASRLVHEVVRPAVGKVREALARDKNPWEPALAAVLVVLDRHPRPEESHG